MNRQLAAHIFLLIVSVIYGANYIIVKGVSPQHVGPSGFIFIRTTTSVAMFWIVSRFFKSKEIEKSDWPRFILCAITGVAVNQLSFFNGLVATSAKDASLIMTSNPIIVLVFSAILIKERLSIQKIIGIILGAAGAIFLIMMNVNPTGTSTVYGNSLVLLNSLSFGIYIVLVKTLMNKYPLFTVLKWVFTIGLVIVIPFGYHEFSEITWDFETDVWLGIFYAVFVVTFGGYFLNILALKRLNPSAVSAYIYLQPILAVILGYVFLDEVLEFIDIIPALLIFTGVFLVSYNKAK